MAEYTQVKADLWQDPEFEAMPACARFLWLNLLTTPTRNTAGLYHMSVGRMCFETGLSPDEVRAALATLVEAGWVFWDGEASLVWVKNFVKRQPFGPMLRPKVMKDLEGIGSHSFVDAFRVYYADTLSIPTPEGIDAHGIPPVRVEIGRAHV